MQDDDDELFGLQYRQRNKMKRTTRPSSELLAAASSSSSSSSSSTSTFTEPHGETSNNTNTTRRMPRTNTHAHPTTTTTTTVTTTLATTATLEPGVSPHDKPIECLPREVVLVILAHLRPPEVVSFLNCSPHLRRRIDDKELWKGCWYWMAEEFSGAVTVHRLLTRVGHADAFDWKMLVLLDWRFQYKDLSYKAIRSVAKELCAKTREVGLVFEVENTEVAISLVCSLLQGLRKIESAYVPNEEETASTEDEYDHDHDWEMAIVSSMALAKVRLKALSTLALQPGVNIDKLIALYEDRFAKYRGLVPETLLPEPETDDSLSIDL